MNFPCRYYLAILLTLSICQLMFVYVYNEIEFHDL